MTRASPPALLCAVMVAVGLMAAQLPDDARARGPSGQILIGACSFIRAHGMAVPAIWKLRVAAGKTGLVRVTDMEIAIPYIDCPAPVVAWSPDGRRYAYNGAGGAYIHRPPHGRVATVSHDNDPFTWNPTGRAITYLEHPAPGPGRLVDVPIGGGAPRIVTTVSPDSTAFQWSPDGKAIYFSEYIYGDDRHYELRRTAPGRSGSTLLGRGMLEDVSPDGRELLVDTYQELWIRSPRPGDRGRLLVRFYGEGGSGPITWSPDRRWIAVVGRIRDGGSFALRLIRRDGKVRRRVTLPDRIGYLGSLSWRQR